MKKWVLLAGAIFGEVVGTLSLRATVDHSGWLILVVLGYIGAYALLGLTLQAGAPVGMVYGIWGASGVVLVAIFGVLLFGEALTALQVVGLGVIIVGVFVIQLGSHETAQMKETVV